MCKPVQDTIINNIPVRADPFLLADESTRLLNLIIHAYALEGVVIERIELIRQEKQIQIYVYKQPLTRTVILHTGKERKHATH